MRSESSSARHMGSLYAPARMTAVLSTEVKHVLARSANWLCKPYGAVNNFHGVQQVDTSSMTLEQGLFKSFDDIVRRQLEAVWHTVTVKTKQVLPLSSCMPTYACQKQRCRLG